MGIVFKVHTDKRGKDHVDIYTNDPKEEHDLIHIDWDSETGKGKITDTTGDEKEETDIGCFLTTACMRNHLKEFDNNCEELKVLRWFRDNFVSKEDINEYYDIAPKIVNIINNDINSNKIYACIYDNLIVKCVELIKKSNYNEAYNLYKNSILILKQYLLKEDINIKKLKL